jgi:hypothetical protein
VVENLEGYDIIRVFTILFSLSALYISARRARNFWELYTRRLRELVISVWAFLVLMLEGNLEQMLLNAPGGPRNILAFFVSALFLRAISRNEGYLTIDKDL